MNLPGERGVRVGDKCETILPISELQDPFPIVVLTIVYRGPTGIELHVFFAHSSLQPSEAP